MPGSSGCGPAAKVISWTKKVCDMLMVGDGEEQGVFSVSLVSCLLVVNWKTCVARAVEMNI